MTEECLAHVKNLSFPRLCGEEGESKARDYILEQCKTSGIKTELQDFSVYRFPDEYLARIVVALWALLLILSLIFLRTAPFISLFSLGLIGLSTIIMSRWHPFYEKFFDIPLGREIHSSNILAKIGENTGSPSLVFMAHYDSKSQMIPIYMRIALIICGPFGTILLTILMLASLFFKHELLFTCAYLCGALVGIAMLLLFLNRSVNESPGAMDNATGVAVLLELARHFKEAAPHGINLYFLFTGAEEIGLAGAVRFLQRHHRTFSRENTYVINLDGVGGKEKLLIVDRYGLIPPVVTSRKLGKLIKATTAVKNTALHSLLLISGALWDHVVWASHGYEAVTLSMGGWEKATLYIHSSLDTWENINPGGLEKTFTICKETAAMVADAGRI